VREVSPATRHLTEEKPRAGEQRTRAGTVCVLHGTFMGQLTCPVCRVTQRELAKQRLMQIAERLVTQYIANSGHPEHEFISMRGVQHSDMETSELAADWRALREAIKECKT
jgi:hypothetical protein